METKDQGGEANGGNGQNEWTLLNLDIVRIFGTICAGYARVRNIP